MNIIKTNFKKGTAKLRITDRDDLWYLSQIIEPGDFVKSKTTRKIKIGENENAKTVKKTLMLKIEVETVDLSENALRINGRIREGPDDIAKDSYHAIALEEKSEFSLEKIQWLDYQKKRIKEASEKSYNYLICIFDREEAMFALTKKFGYEILVKIKGEVPKKDRKINIKKAFYDELIKALETYNDRHKPEAVIVASPAFYKEDLMKKVKNQDLKKKIVTATCSEIGERSLDEVLKRPELAQVLKTSRAREEQLLVDELLTEIDQDKLAVYGEEDVKKAVQAGAVKSLLVTDSHIQKLRESNNYNQLEEQMKTIDSMQGEIHILSSELESGKKLNGLGGVAAILRYKLEW